MDPPAPEEARRSGRSPAARSRDRIAERADRLSGRRAVRRHRVPAVRVHADRAADRAVDYGPPRRAGAGRERGQEAHRGQSQASSGQARSAKLSGMNGAAKEPVPQLKQQKQNRGNTQAQTKNDPAKTISTELAAYIVFPFAVLGMPWQRLRVAPLLACAALLCAALLVLFAAFGKTSLGADVPQFGLWRCLAEFALGMVLCRLWQELCGRRGAALAACAAGAIEIAAGKHAGLQ